jgi:aspartate dehydrogenase
VAQAFAEPTDGMRLVSVLVRSLQRVRPEALERFGPVFTDTWEDVVSQRPDIVVEAAGPEAVRSCGPAALISGMDLVIVSVGALSDDNLLLHLEQTARKSGACILVPSGAVGGIEAIRAASLAGLSAVSHTIRKPPQALLDKERAAEVHAIGQPLQVFEGSARESVAAFPENTNVTATVSLAGVGFDRTIVRVIADPGVDRNTHEIEVRGTFGEFSFKIQNVPFASNPKTSRLVAFSVISLLRSRTSSLIVGG